MEAGLGADSTERYDERDGMKVGVVGASGYAGVELLRLCAGHPDLEVAVATAGEHRGEAVARHTPSLAASYPDLSYSATEVSELDGLDVVFLALPHGRSQQLVPELTSAVGVIVDLAADFRLHDPSLYPTWYGEVHAAPDLLGSFVYGLPELHRDQLAGARLIAAPGCYPTAAILALWPLIRAGLVDVPGHPHPPVRSVAAAHRRCRQRRLRGGTGGVGAPPLRLGGRGLRRLRPARPPAHRRDGAEPRHAGAVHAPPGPHGPGDPGHLLRPDRIGGRRSRR